MGGTLGAIFGILLAALVTAVTEHTVKVDAEAVCGACAKKALDSSKWLTGDGGGDSTAMDVQISFCQVLYSAKSLGQADRICQARGGHLPGFDGDMCEHYRWTLGQYTRIQRCSICVFQLLQIS
ncbi:hypothetical protein V1504DRAFT_436428 [Lipomyces starkeyi]